MRFAREQVRSLILAALPAAIGTTAPNPVLYGPGSPLDSLGLVNLLADVEMQISSETGRDIVLASERAMSRRSSPFRDVDALADYVMELLAEGGEGVGT